MSIAFLKTLSEKFNAVLISITGLTNIINELTGCNETYTNDEKKTKKIRYSNTHWTCYFNKKLKSFNKDHPNTVGTIIAPMKMKQLIININ